MEFNDGTTVPPHIPEFVEFRDGGAGSKDVATGYPPAASCKLARAI
jgi:hypothetical protein